MSKYHFAPPVPVLLTPIQLSTNHIPSCRQTFNDIHQEVHSGKTWCSICGEEISGGQSILDYCTLCGDHTDEVERKIRKECLAIKQAYLATVAAERNMPMPEEGYGAQKFWETTVLHGQCKVGLYRMADAVREAFPAGPDLPILGLDEVQFETQPWYGYHHCSFAIDTKHGGFIFDPTGAQFGPSWPVVERVEKYAGRIATLTSLTPLGDHKEKQEALLRKEASARGSLLVRPRTLLASSASQPPSSSRPF